MRKGITACVGMIAALVLLLIGFLGPWYVIDTTGIFGSDYHANLFLTRMELQAQGQGIFVSMGYDDVKNNAQNLPLNMESFAAIDTAFILTILAFITAVLAIACMGAVVFEKGTLKTMKYGGGFFAFSRFCSLYFPHCIS